MTTTVLALRLSRTPVQRGRPAPRPGVTALDALRDIGRDAVLDALVRQRAVVTEGVPAR